MEWDWLGKEKKERGLGRTEWDKIGWDKLLWGWVVWSGMGKERMEWDRKGQDNVGQGRIVYDKRETIIGNERKGKDRIGWIDQEDR